MTGRHGHGLVIGKFYPPHAGHVALVTAALAASERVTVEVIGSETESLDVELRGRWVRELFPTTRVVTAVDEAEIDFASEAAWQHHTAVIAGLLDPGDGPVDVVFSSDTYGEELARRLGARWCQVDPGRRSIPLRGNQIRYDIPGYWWALPAPVRQHLAKRVVVLGAESSGTTTLSRALASHLGAPWVPEYGREWSAIRPGGLAAPWHTAEFDHVAAEQARQEDDAARTTRIPLVVCDTDVLATTVWHERYVGRPSPTVCASAAQRHPDLYLLTDIDIPFEDDGMRDGEHLRSDMHARFLEVLRDQPVTWRLVSGGHQDRLRTALDEVTALLDRGWGLAPSLEEQQRTRRMEDSPHA